MKEPLGEPAPAGKVLPLVAEPLHGKYTSLVPFHTSDTDAIHEELFGEGTEDMWTYIPIELPTDTTQTGAALENLIRLSSSSNSFFYAVLSAPASDPSSKPLGLITYVNVGPEHRRIEIGVIFGPKLQRTRVATEAFYLMMKNAFDTLGYTRLEWKANEFNTGSVAAAKRLGFQYEGTLR
jgi:RimJ/RimL family protein N-acetyltransferase